MTDIELARECGAQIDTFSSNGKVFIDFTPDKLSAFAERIRADERERCAKICDEREKTAEWGWLNDEAKQCATAIRSSAGRGK